jgi:hypothetical protein
MSRFGVPIGTISSWVTVMAILCGICFANPATAQNKTQSTTQLRQEADFHVTSFQLYYGSDVKILSSLEDNLAVNQLIAVDLRALSEEQLERLQRSVRKQKAKLIAYISIGELHSRELGLFEDFATSRDANANVKKLKSQVLLGENTTYHSLYADVGNETWREFVFDKAEKIMEMRSRRSLS